ncbi:alpha/beta hydrolase [bacterium]|nr:alpha/beta hydrolase [candidate division CSSED10-310 bacterium]
MSRYRFEHGMMVREIPGSKSEGILLYLHGLGESGISLESIATHPELRGFHHILPDLPGYGRSSWPVTPLSLQETALFLLDWIDQRKLDRIILIGHSMGGVLGQYLCEERPHIFLGIINIEGNISPGDCTFSGQAITYTQEEFEVHGFDWLRKGVYLSGARRKALQGYYASLRFASPQQFWRHSNDLVNLSKDGTLARSFTGLQQRKRFIAGAPDGLCGTSLELLKKENTPLSIIRPAGHWPFLDKPSSFIAEILPFITGKTTDELAALSSPLPTTPR